MPNKDDFYDILQRIAEALETIAERLREISNTIGAK